MKLIGKIELKKNLYVDYYTSQHSKLKLIVTNNKGPFIDASIIFITETMSNAGIPHALEHLIFMGSRKHPFKGFVSSITNLNFGYINGKTTRDHTIYNFNAAGSNAFFKCFPVIIDHLLCPQLLPSQFLTEVYTVDGEGQDIGVMYSEIKAKCFDTEILLSIIVSEMLYGKNSPFGKFTGGTIDGITELCNIDEVKSYHRKNYHFNNMVITISGSLDTERLITEIGKIEKEYYYLIPNNFPRPFSYNISNINCNKFSTICYPSNEEEFGIVQLVYLTSSGQNLEQNLALNILFNYLCDGPLKQEFIETSPNQPYANSINISLLEQKICEITVLFEGVPFDKLFYIKDRFFSPKITNHIIDMEKIIFSIDKRLNHFKIVLENNLHNFVKDCAIGHQLFGPVDVNAQERDLRLRLLEPIHLERLREKPQNFWHNLYKQTFYANFICIIGKPSKVLARNYAEAERKRIDARIKELGPQGLAIKRRILNDALKQNTSIEPTEEDYNKNIVKSLESVTLFKYSTNVIMNWPLKIIWNELDTEFCQVKILFDTENIPKKSRMFLMLWSQLMFKSCTIINNEKLTTEEFENKLDSDGINYSTTFGINELYTKFISINIRVKGNDYIKISEYAKIFLTNIVYDRDSILNCCQHLEYASNNINDGAILTNILTDLMIYDESSNDLISNTILLKKFHQSIIKDLNEEKVEYVQQCLKNLNDEIRSSNVNIHFIGKKNMDHEKSLEKDWLFLTNKPPELHKFTEISGELNDTLFLKAKRTCIKHLLSLRKTLQSTTNYSILSHMRNVGPNFLENLISEVFHLDKKEVLRKASSLIMALFDPTKSVTAIAIGNAYSHELENLFPNIIIKRLSDLQL